MKKLIFILIFMSVFLLLFTSNNILEKNYDRSVSKKDTITFGLREVSNSDRLQRFIDNLDKNKKDRVNLVAQINTKYSIKQSVAEVS